MGEVNINEEFGDRESYAYQVGRTIGKQWDNSFLAKLGLENAQASGRTLRDQERKLEENKSEAQVRKGRPVTTGVLHYFPDAILAVAECSRAGNEQHNPGQPLHWDKTKSTDHLDCIGRHLLDAGTLDTDGIRHSAKVAWRALANLQMEIDNESV